MFRAGKRSAPCLVGADGMKPQRMSSPRQPTTTHWHDPARVDSSSSQRRRRINAFQRRMRLALHATGPPIRQHGIGVGRRRGRLNATHLDSRAPVSPLYPLHRDNLPLTRCRQRPWSRRPLAGAGHDAQAETAQRGCQADSSKPTWITTMMTTTRPLICHQMTRGRPKHLSNEKSPY